MSAYRFKLELAGQMIYGLAFATEAELDQFCAARGIEIARPSAPASPLGDDPRPRGRPSFNAAIAAAAEALEPELAGCNSLSARARLVQRHIARAAPDDAASVPSIHTVGIYLGKYLANSRRAMIGAAGRRIDAQSNHRETKRSRQRS